MKLLLNLAVLFSAAAAFSDVRVHMEADIKKFTSSHWVFEGRAVSTEMVEAVFVLKHDKAALQKFEAQFNDLSSPFSPNYGKWLSKEEIVSQIAPPEENLKTVVDYITSYGLTSKDFRISDYRDKVFVKLPATLAGDMLDTEFARFRSVDDKNVALLRVVKPYTLPADVANVVSLVDDIVRFPSIRRANLVYPEEKVQKADIAPFGTQCGLKCSTYTTPAVLAVQYNFSYGSISVAKGNEVAVAEFQYQYYDQADLTNMETTCGINILTPVAVGGNNERICNTGCVEALLDIEYIGAITYPIPMTTIYSGTYSLQAWADQITSMSPLIWVHSVSYGNDEVQQTSSAYMESCNTQFQVAGTLGISILFASGDQGVWGRSGVGSVYNPDFPAGSPYVTAVGGTNLQTAGVVGTESAWSCGGGGFSNEFATPSWQQTNVSNYFSLLAANNLTPPTSYFNASGRGYPDISALGGQTNAYCVFVGGGSKSEGVAGTSASCPVAAGIFAQLNNVRIAAGKSTLGWLNPFIYQVAAVKGCFNDVSDKTSNYCNAGTVGFATLTGWDAATGWGTPNYGCLATLM